MRGKRSRRRVMKRKAARKAGVEAENKAEIGRFGG